MSKLLIYQELGPKKGIRYSREHVRRLVKAKKFPAPVKPANVALRGSRTRWTSMSRKWLTLVELLPSPSHQGGEQ